MQRPRKGLGQIFSAGGGKSAEKKRKRGEFLFD
jgi:hypothetical protein